MEEFDKLVEIIRKLRGPDGCPWDRKQNFGSMRNNFIEELYEFIEGLDENNFDLMKEELGDILLHIVFYSILGEEKNKFNLKDIINNISEKLVTRHPHVFGDVKVKDSDEVIYNWEKIKKQEKKRESILSGVPNVFPSIIKAYKVQKKAAHVGFDFPNIEGVIGKVIEEFNELLSAVYNEGYTKKKLKITVNETNEKQNKKDEIDEVGDLLFSIVNLSRFLKKDPDYALNKTINKFINRFKYLEKNYNFHLDNKNIDMDKLDKLWEESKKLY